MIPLQLCTLLSLTVVTAMVSLGQITLQADTTPKAPKGVVPTAEEAYPALYWGTLNSGVKTSDVYTEGNLSLVLPLWSSLGLEDQIGGGYLFITPYSSLGEGGELANSLGLGWRYLFNEQPVSALTAKTPTGLLTEGFYVGANVFVDNLQTQFDNDFWQLGLGVEVGSRYLELRGNYYLPFDGDRKLADRQVSERTFTTKSKARQTSSTTSYTTTNTQQQTAQSPYATGNTIQQDVYLTDTAETIATTTTRSTTYTTTTRTRVRTITSLFEEGMEGWDAEAAILLPWVDQYLDVSLIGGYYSFDNQPFGPQRGGSGKTEGWKLGLEVRPVPAVVLGGMWYEDEGLTGSDWVVSAGLQIPLGRDWKDSFKPRRRHLVERMMEPVARQNAAIKTALTSHADQQVQQKSTTTASTSSHTQSAVVQRTVTQSKQSITIAEDIIFVNNGGPVGNGIAQAGTVQTGTAEQPYNTIQKGADQAGTNNLSNQRVWTVYTQGAGTHGGSTYTESVTLSSSAKLTTSAIPIPGQQGTSFGTGDRPTIAGGIAGQQGKFLTGTTRPSVVTIEGYKITGGYVSGDTLSAHVPTGVPTADGNGIHLKNIRTVIARDNVVQDTQVGIFVERRANLTVELTDNVTNQNTMAGIVAYTEKNLTGEIRGNTANNNGYVGIGAMAFGRFSAEVSDNITNDNPYVGLAVGGNIYHADLTNNTAHRNGYVGIAGIGLTRFKGDVTGNQANENGYLGIGVGGNQFLGDIANNTATDNGYVGLVGIGLSLFKGNVYDNTTHENGYVGLGVGGMEFRGDIHHNNAGGNGYVGILGAGLNSFRGDVYSNTAGGNGYVGLGVGGTIFRGNIYDNTTSNNMGVGLGVLAEDFRGDVRDNRANNNGYLGILAYVANDFTGDVTGNETSGGHVLAGMMMNVGGRFKGNITDHVANDNLGTGMLVEVQGNFLGDIRDNTATTNGLDGINLLVGGNFNGSIADNTTSHNGLSGLFADVQGRYVGDFTRNVAMVNYDDGLHLGVADNLRGNVTNNTAHDNGLTGLIVVVNGNIIGDVTGNTAMRNDIGIGVYANRFTGAFTDNTAQDNLTFGFETDVNRIFTGPFDQNSATNNGTGTAAENYHNLDKLLANP